MNSILNSISTGDLQVQITPEEKPVKQDSIIDLLKDLEIEFKPIVKPESSKIEIEGIIEILPQKEYTTEIENFIQHLPNQCLPQLDENQFDTGFGENNDLHYETLCKLPELKTPLYQENYLQEFVSEEEKAAARHALGLYNKEDIVAMSLLTAEDQLPSDNDWLNSTLKQLRKGDKFFTPITSTKAVYDSEGNTLNNILNNIDSLIVTQQKEIVKINEISNLDVITSLGDVKLFLQGFNNGDNLYNTLETMNQEMIRFEKTGQITI